MIKAIPTEYAGTRFRFSWFEAHKHLAVKNEVMFWRKTGNAVQWRGRTQ